MGRLSTLSDPPDADRDFDQGGASRSDGVTRLDDELLVPAKPFGFLAAALNEYEPARPEVHRSRVRPDPRRSLLARVSIRGESLLRGEPVRGAASVSRSDHGCRSAQLNGCRCCRFSPSRH